MITKKDYKAIAEIIEEHLRNKEVCLPFANELADYFEKDNEKFDKDRFLKACGVEE